MPGLTQNTILKIENLSTGYDKKQVLFDVSLEIQQGETVLLVGSNGSGKSTLFKAVYGLLDIWEGSVEYENQALHNSQLKTHNSRLLNKGIMYIPQKNELYEDMSVFENLKMSLLHLNSKQETNKRIEEVLNQMPSLKINLKQASNKLSGGERKLLSLGMVLSNKPKLLLYDEPLAGLSGSNVNIVLKWLEVLKKNGTTLLMIEHRIKELTKFTDRIIGLKLGTLTTEKLNDVETVKQFLV